MLLLFFSFLSVPIVAQDAPGPSANSSPDALSFEQLFEIASQGNLQIIAIRRRQDVAKAGVVIASQRPNPEITTEYTKSEPRMNYSIGQPIELGGKRSKRIAVARGELFLTELDVEAALRNLRRALRSSYFGLGLARDLVDLTRQSVEQAAKLAEIAQVRYEAGDVAQFEVLQARLSVDRAKNDLAKTQNAERIALSSLNLLLNRAPDTPAQLRETLLIPRPPIDVASLIQASLTQNVDLKTAAQQIAVEQSRLKLAHAERYPNLKIEPGIETIEPSFPHNVAFKMAVSLPLPIFNRNKGEIAKSNAMIAQLTAERDALTQQVSYSIGQASLRLESARQQVEFFETKLLPDAERVRSLAEEAYREGQTGLLPVIDAQRNARDVRGAYLQALFDFQSAIGELESVTGVRLR
jgi:cobalt-zinc-cadmium efflux system outer membrane protein